jgi:hypothetical protein
MAENPTGGTGKDSPDLKKLRSEVGSEIDNIDSDRKGPTTARAAAQMLAVGYDPADIAARLNYVSPAAARMAATKAIADSAGDNDWVALRNLTGKRYEMLLRSVAVKALDTKDPEHLAYARMFLEITKQIAILHGLNAPQRLEVTNPDAREFEEVIQRIALELGHTVAQEADIFNLEEDDDGVWKSEGDSDETQAS